MPELWQNRACPKRSSRKDFVQNALRVVEIATGAPLKSKKNPAAVALGKLGGRKGGRAPITDHVWTVSKLVMLQELATKKVAA